MAVKFGKLALWMSGHSAAWNNGFRKIFNAGWRETVRPLRFFCSCLPPSFLIHQRNLMRSHDDAGDPVTVN